MRILFVAIASSIHTVRWINLLAEQGWDIHLFPSHDSTVHSELEHVTLHDCIVRLPDLDRSVVQKEGRIPWPFPKLAKEADRALKYLRRSPYLSKFATERSIRLARLIEKVKPDFVHSLEMQYAGYLTIEAKKNTAEQFPPWIMSIWGSDIYLFSRYTEHAKKIREVLTNCDYFGCECNRDEELARQLGFRGEFLPRFPMFGGINTKKVSQLRSSGPTSSRRLILLKGYQGWAGRALAGLAAIEMCAQVLQGYRIAIYSASPEVELRAKLLSQSTGIPVDIIPFSPHQEILKLHGEARISIGLSISDGLPSSFIEAMAMGSFPIQSFTGCADEWVIDGQTGLLVPPEDPQIIAHAIRRAATDDALVDQAARINTQRIVEHLDTSIIKHRVIETYKHLADL
jgi:hypothetical protein